MDSRLFLPVIAGPTASGKTALAAELAKRMDGEVVSADSMQIYEGLRIGTARPTQSEMRGVPTTCSVFFLFPRGTASQDMSRMPAG